MADLFDPLELRGVEIPNRITVSPMCQYSCEERDGMPTEWHRQHLESRATGGAGLVLTEATAVEPRGRITPEDLGIWNDEQRDGLKPITEFVASQGAVSGIQLAHAGRKASDSRPWEGENPVQPEDGGWEVRSPSGEPWPYPDETVPTQRMDESDIEDVVESFRAAARRADEAGFDIAEVHGAHGYLLHQFLSPVTNDREDEYGGSFENRTRLIRDVTEAVREAFPDEKPVFVRLSATDWMGEDAWTVDDTVELAGELDSLGADLIDVSGGGIAPGSWPDSAGPNYQVPYAEAVREGTDLAVGAVGGVTEASQADALIRNGRADLAIIGREHLRDPYFALHAAQELGAEDRIDVPIQYHRAF